APIETSLSTRRIGQFPEYFTEIVEFTKGTNYKLLIMSDSVDYGSIWEPALHQEFHNALMMVLKCASKHCIRVLISGPARITETTLWSKETDLKLCKIKLRQSGFAAQHS